METYNRSRLEIINYVTVFCVQTYFGPGQSCRNDPERSFHGGYVTDERPPIGALCRLLSAPTSKYYLAWLIEIKDEGGLGPNYLLKSIEDGSLCWWTNVAISWLPLKTSNNYGMWKWTDKQFEFYDRWLRACRKGDDFLTKPLLPTFNEDGSVTLGTREYMNGLDGKGGYMPKKSFPNWKKVTFAEMLAFFKYASKSRPIKKKSA